MTNTAGDRSAAAVITAPSRATWFSARLRFALFLRDETTFRYQTLVVVFRAESHQAALPAALDVGWSRERWYRNGDGTAMRLALDEVESLDQVGELTHGAEVACLWSGEFCPSPYRIDHRFTPENSRPQTTI